MRDALQWLDLRRDNELFGGMANLPIGTLVDGRPFYDNDLSDGMGFNNRRGHDLLLTNTDRGHGHTLSFGLEKKFLFGLSVYGAYAHQNIKEVSAAAGAVAFLAYGQSATANPNDPALATSNYERAHRIVGALTFDRPLLADITRSNSKAIKDLNTSISLFVESRSGQPFSYTFADDRLDANGNRIPNPLFGEEADFSFSNRQLFYVPAPDGRDRVVLDGIDRAEFNAFLKDTGLDKYSGQIAPRNAFRGPWLNRLDVRFAQELEKRSGAKLIIDIQNLGNLLNSSWGVHRQPVFPFTAPVVDVNVDPTTGQYIYSNLRTEDPSLVDVLRSVWRIQTSLQFQF